MLLPFYHRTTVLVVDDDPGFLESFEYRYGQEFKCRVTKSPEEAIAVLDQSYRDWQLNTDFIKTFEGQIDGPSILPGEALLKVSISSLRSLAGRHTRSDLISVAVVDFAMPGMTGVDLCRQIRHLPTKRLLLTGKTGDETAVSAFNEGLIDQFLRKQDPKVTVKLPAEIARLKKSFFELASQPLKPMVGSASTAFLSDPDVVSRIGAIFESMGAMEHYISIAPPGFIVTSADEQMSILLIYDDETVRAHREIALSAGAPLGLLDRLEREDVIAHFPTANGYYDPELGDSWPRFLFSSEAIGRNAKWRIALVTGDLCAPHPEAVI